MERRKILWNKLMQEMFWLLIAILGIIILICNITKTVPGFEGRIETIVSTIIAYGFLLGPALTAVALGAFWETRNTYPKKRTR